VLALGQDNEPSKKTATTSPTANSSDQGPNGPATENTYDRIELLSDTNSTENTHSPIDVLSDTNGLDLRPYLKQLMGQVRAIWYKNIPEAARRPIMKKGKVSIEFRVMKDGKIEDVKNVETSGDPMLDGAAYKSIIASNQLAPLPSGFACEYVALRFHFYYNPKPADLQPPTQQDSLVPCVTTTIRDVRSIGITIFPTSAQVVIGAKEQFAATVTGDPVSHVTWGVEGRGCINSTCGVISSNGLYTAPTKIPDPAIITVTVTSDESREAASASVTIIQPTSTR
jgi:TonB family protein